MDRVGQRPRSKASSAWNATAHATTAGLYAQITQRLLAIAAASWNN
jgi:hypothetical protein